MLEYRKPEMSQGDFVIMKAPCKHNPCQGKESKLFNELDDYEAVEVLKRELSEASSNEAAA